MVCIYIVFCKTERFSASCNNFQIVSVKMRNGKYASWEQEIYFGREHSSSHIRVRRSFNIFIIKDPFLTNLVKFFFNHLWNNFIEYSKIVEKKTWRSALILFHTLTLHLTYLNLVFIKLVSWAVQPFKKFFSKFKYCFLRYLLWFFGRWFYQRKYHKLSENFQRSWFNWRSLKIYSWRSWWQNFVSCK